MLPEPLPGIERGPPTFLGLAYHNSLQVENPNSITRCPVLYCKRNQCTQPALL
jgi:hypothetical protein